MTGHEREMQLLRALTADISARLGELRAEGVELEEAAAMVVAGTVTALACIVAAERACSHVEGAEVVRDTAASLAQALRPPLP